MSTKRGNVKTIRPFVIDEIMLKGNFFSPEEKEYIVTAVNAHEELLKAAKNARNVLAALAMGHLKEIKADMPALQSLRNAIANAEGK